VIPGDGRVAVARHAAPSAFSTPRRGDSPARPTPSARRRVPVSTSGRILVAAVAAGAALPAVQTLDTHSADAESAVPTAAPAALALTAAAGPVAPAVTPAASPRGGWSSVSPVLAERGDREGPSAGDRDDVSSLTKAISLERESGEPDFGRPYTAGNDDTLNGQIAKALGLMGLPQKLAPGVKQIIMRESTGNANAVNDWDSNAAAGTPSKGLMQLIDTTFENAVLPSLEDEGIFDPVANITAGVRTMIANHSIDDVMQGGRKNSSGNYIGYGGAKVPTDGLS